MKLYHGTFEKYYEKIKEEKTIKPRFGVNPDIDLIDVVLNKYLDDVNIRSGAVYLFDDNGHANTYEYVFEVQIEKLNKNLLYVADFRISTDIYNEIMRGKNEGKIKRLCYDYAENFMTYGTYLIKRDKIKIPEFLYFGKIPFSYTNLVNKY